MYNNSSCSLRVHKLSKRYGRLKLFKDLDFELKENSSLGITGINGSGKSTLLKILVGLIPSSSGKIEVKADDNILNHDKIRQIMKLLSPEISVYDMLTASENLIFFANMSGFKLDKITEQKLLQKVGLSDRGNDLVHVYSSGMKQRLKYAVTLLSKPKILLLDEPTANLDDDGKAIVVGIIKEQKKYGSLIIATNESEDLKYVDETIKLGI